MGQSIFKALSKSPIADRMRVVFCNSDKEGAGYYLDQHSPSIKIIGREIVPLAASPDYADAITALMSTYNVDIIYSGTQHELRSLASRGISKIACPPLSIVDKCLDKKKTASLLHQHNIDVPKTFYLSEIIENKTAVNGIEKIIIKPNESSASRNISIYSDHEALMFDVKRLAGLKKDCVVQEYIEGDEYTCGLYIDRYTSQIATIAMQRKLSPDGASIYGEIIEDENINLYLQKIGVCLNKSGLIFGHVNVQLRKTSNNKCYMFEINGRLSSTESPKATFGFNSSYAYFENIVLERSATLLRYNGKCSKFLRYYDEVYF